MLFVFHSKGKQKGRISQALENRNISIRAMDRDPGETKPEVETERAVTLASFCCVVRALYKEEVPP